MAVDYDSLTLGGAIELLGPPGGSPSAIPACKGAMFKLQPSFDKGAAQPTTDYVGSLLFDGSRPFGRRADNRTITLPVHIHGTDFSNLAAAMEVLLQTIDQDTWPMVWTRRQGPDDPQQYPLVLDCFRAGASTVTGGGVDGALINPIGMVSLSIPALPYGRSQSPILVPLASPVTGGPEPPPNPVTLDSFGTVSGTGFTRSGSAFIVGPTSAHWNPASLGNPSGKGIFPSYTSSFSATDLTGLTNLSVFAGFGGSGFYYYFWSGGTVTFAFTLVDSNGGTISISVPVQVSSGTSSSSPHFTQVTAPIPQDRTDFDYTTVVSCQTSATNIRPGELAYTDFYLDDLTAVPPSQVTPVSDRGHVYTIRGVVGTARTTVSIKAQERAS